MTADKNVNGKGKAHGGSVRNEDFVAKWTRSQGCFILANNLLRLFPCPETLLEVEIKSSGIINMLEEISEQTNVQAVTQILLLVFHKI